MASGARRGKGRLEDECLRSGASGGRVCEIHAINELTCRSERKILMKSAEKPSFTRTLENAEPEEFDLVILGGGTGSTIAAWTFAGQGQRVAVIDRKYIGGSCPNIACLPSKNIIHSAKVAFYFSRSEDFGITCHGSTVNMSAVLDRKRRMVSAVNQIYLDNYRNTWAKFILGTG